MSRVWYTHPKNPGSLTSPQTCWSWGKKEKGGVSVFKNYHKSKNVCWKILISFCEVGRRVERYSISPKISGTFRKATGQGGWSCIHDPLPTVVQCSITKLSKQYGYTQNTGYKQVSKLTFVVWGSWRAVRYSIRLQCDSDAWLYNR